MRLSIIIPVYNVAPYLAECLDSVLTQDFEDYEVLCVEDKSTDKSLSILKEYEQRFEQIKLIRHSENKGLSAARNTGIRAARGDYIQFVDSDDLIVPGACKLLYEYAEAQAADIVYFNMEFLNDKEANLVREKQKNKEFEGMYKGIELFCKYQEAGTPKPEAVRHFIKRAFLVSNHIKFYEKIIHEDILFSFQVAMKAKKVVDLNRKLYIYRQRKGSISWGNKDKRAASLFVCLMNIGSAWMTNEFSDYENEWIFHYIEGVYKSYLYSKGYQKESEPVGGLKERMLFKMFASDYLENIKFSEEDITKLRASKTIILYGAGRRAVEILNALQLLNIQVDGIAVTDMAGNPDSINDIVVKSIYDYLSCKEALIVLGTDEKYKDEIIKILIDLQFCRYISPQMI